MIITAAPHVNANLAVALDPALEPATRAAAWDLFELGSWVDAVMETGLHVDRLDQPMRDRVEFAMRRHVEAQKEPEGGW